MNSLRFFQGGGILLLFAGWLMYTSAYSDDVIPSFLPLDDLPDAFLRRAFAISGDGSTVVGAGITNLNPDSCMRWVASEGIEELVSTTFPCDVVSDVSWDGTVVAGTLLGRTGEGFAAWEAARWTNEEGMVGIGFLEGEERSAANGMSADGSVIVGYSGEAFEEEAFLWTAEGGMQGLGKTSDIDRFSKARDVSADGTVVVGEIGRVGVGAFRWTHEDGMVLINPASGVSGAEGISGDGNVIAGWYRLYAGEQEASLWMADEFIRIGDLPGGDIYSGAQAASADGSVVVGYGNMGGGGVPDTAFVWDYINGMRPLKHVLEAAGLDLGEWRLTHAHDISDDGNTIAGTGINPDGVQQGWIATIENCSLESRLDQQQDRYETGTGTGNIAIGSATDFTLAQVVTSGLGGRLVQIDMPIACYSGDLAVEIRNVTVNDDGDYIPGEVVKTSRTFPAEELPIPPITEPWDFVPLQLTQPAPIAVGQKFAIVLRNPSGACGINPSEPGDLYPGGHVFARDGNSPFDSWQRATEVEGYDDLPFRTHVEVCELYRAFDSLTGDGSLDPRMPIGGISSSDTLGFSASFILSQRSDGIVPTEEELAIIIKPAPLPGNELGMTYKITIPRGSLVPANSKEASFKIIDRDPLLNGARLTYHRNGTEVADLSRYLSGIDVSLKPKGNSYYLDVEIENIAPITINEHTLLPFSGGETIMVQMRNDGGTAHLGSMSYIHTSEGYVPYGSLPPHIVYPVTFLKVSGGVTREGSLESFSYAARFEYAENSQGFDPATEWLHVIMTGLANPLDTAPVELPLVGFTVPPGSLQPGAKNGEYVFRSLLPTRDGVIYQMLNNGEVTDFTDYLSDISVKLVNVKQNIYQIKIEAEAQTELDMPVMLPWAANSSITLFLGDDGGGTRMASSKFTYSVPSASNVTLTLDQQQPEIPSLRETGSIQIGSTSDQTLAQVVTAGISGKIAQVDLPVFCTEGSDLSLEIRGVQRNGQDQPVPDDTVLTKALIPSAELPPYYDIDNPVFRRLSLSKHAEIEAGAMFSIVMYSQGSCATPHGPLGDPYPGGDSWYKNSTAQSWTRTNGTVRMDFPFRTWVQQ